MANKLAGLKGLWKKANENKGAGNFGNDIDDGRYMSILTDADLGESQGSGRLQIMLEFTIQEGEFEKKTKRTYIGLDSEMGVQIAVNTLARLGVEVEDPSELEAKLKEIRGKVCKIQLKTKAGTDFQNVYILKVLGIEPVSEEAAASAPVEEPEDEPVAEEPKAKPAKKKAEPVAEPEAEAVAEPVEDLGEEVELKVGMAVAFNLNKKEVEGKIFALEEEDGKVIVSFGGKKYRVPCESISVI